MASWISKLNPTPAFPSYRGPYKVGTIDVEIAASDLQDASQPSPAPTVAFRLFYPSISPTKSTKPVHWLQAPQRSTLSAYARFLGAGGAFSDIFSYFPQLLYHIQIPAFRDAPLHASPSPYSKWPVLVFSHGLGGSRNSYSHICGSLASYGMVVVAPEHRDGSCPISHVRATDGTPATSVDYRRISHKASPEVYQGRDEMLQTRIWELGMVHEALRKIHVGEEIQNLDTKPGNSKNADAIDVLSVFKGRLAMDHSGSIAYAGHSFGASTTVQFLKTLFYHPRNPNRWPGSTSFTSGLLTFEPSQSLLTQISHTSPTILLDLWAMPLKSDTDIAEATNSAPMPFFTASDTTDLPSSQEVAPVLAVLSSAFVNWKGNFNDVQRMLANPKSTSTTPPARIFYPLNSAHLSQSDFGVLFPRVTKYLAKAEEPERTLHLNVRAILQMLRSRGVEVAGDDDPAILSTKEDAVRGWVAVKPEGTNSISEEKQSASTLGEADAMANGELTGAKHDQRAIRSNY